MRAEGGGGEHMRGDTTIHYTTRQLNAITPMVTTA